MFAAALPPSDNFWLAPVCFVPVFAAVSRTRLILGLIGAFITMATTTIAVEQAIFYRAAIPQPGGNWTYLGCMLFGVVVAVVSCSLAESKMPPDEQVFVLASVAVATELALFLFLPGHLALTQYGVPGMLKLASVGGIWIVSFLLWGCNIAIAGLLSVPHVSAPTPRFLGRKGLVVLIGSAVIVSWLNVWPLRSNPPSTPVAAVQSVSIELKDYEHWDLEARKRGALLVVWPESTAIAMAPGADTTELLALSARPGQPAFVATFADQFKPLSHNVGALFAHGFESKRYFKRKLFGSENNDHTPGSSAVVAPWFGGYRVGLSICYDSCFQALMHETRSVGADIIALPTYDPSSPNGFMAAVHAAFTPFGPPS